MKRLLLLFVVFFPLSIFAQTKHVVKAKETLYLVAKKYNIAPSVLASYNKLSKDAVLKIGQELKIPTKKSAAPPPINADKNKPSNIYKNQGTPVYHVVQKKETLTQISAKYNVKSSEIKKWNQLTSDALKTNQKIIVGYNKKVNGSVATPNPLTKRSDSVQGQQPQKQIIKSASSVKKDTVKHVKTDTIAVAKTTTSGRDFKGGFFKNLYDNQSNAKSDLATQQGTAASFKSSSGWEDGKYYCLHNTAMAGTIIKVTNNENGKFIFAKVLDVIPDIKQNENIIIRISNAAADELGVKGDRFSATLNY